jgi:uncharacterized membrane protein YhhN
MTRRAATTASRLALGYAGASLLDSALAGSDSRVARRFRYLTKPVLMPTLAAALTASGGRPGTGAVGTRRATVAAEALSWAGDVALLPGGQRSFLAGLGSFFAAHVGYITGFAAARDRRLSLTRAPGVRAAAVLAVTGAPAMAIAAGRTDPRLRWPVAAYATVLSALFAGSTVLDRDLPAGARRRIRVGTTLFLASDLMLGLREFVLPAGCGGRLDAAVMASYTAGQGLIAAGVAEL